MEMAAKAPANSIITIAHGGSETLTDEMGATAIADIVKDPQVKTFFQALKNIAVSKGAQMPSGPLVKLMRIGNIAKASEMQNGGRVAGLIIDKFDPQNEIFEGCFYVLFDGGKERTAKVSSFVENIISEFGGTDKVITNELSIGTLETVKQYSIPTGSISVTVNLATKGSYSLAVVTMSGSEERYLNLLSECSESKVKSLKAFEGCNLQGDDIIVSLNMSNYFGALEQAMQFEPESRKIFNMLKETKMDEIGTIYYRLGFAGKQIVIDCVATNYGIYMDMVKPIDMKNMRAIPADATMAWSVNYNLPEIVELYKSMISTMAGDQAIDMINAKLSEAEANSGVAIRDGILNNLTGEASCCVTFNEYTGVLGTTSSSIVTVYDSKKFAENLDAAFEFGINMAGDRTQVDHVTQDIEGITVSTLNIPKLTAFGIQPSMVIADDNHIIFGLSQATALKSAKLYASGNDDGSILTNDKFKSALASAPDKLLTFGYCDSASALKAVSTTVNTYWPIASIAAASKGLNLPPTLPQIAEKFLELPVSYTWSTEMSDGRMYSHIQTDGIGLATLGAAYAGAVSSFALPAFSKGREQAEQAAAMSSLKQVSTAIILYSSDNDSKYPKNLSELEGYLDNNSILDGGKGFKPVTYRGDDLNLDSDNGLITLYTSTENDHNKVYLAAYVDGHVNRMSADDFVDAIKADNEKRQAAGLATKELE